MMKINFYLRIFGAALCLLILPDNAFSMRGRRAFDDLALGGNRAALGINRGQNDAALGLANLFGSFAGVGNQGRKMQKMQALLGFADALAKIRARHDEFSGLLGGAAQARALENDVAQQIKELAKSDNSWGLALAIGLGGQELQFESFPTVGKGLSTGMMMLTARGVADAMRDPIKNAVGKVVGGGLDFAIDQLVAIVNAVREKLFHGGHKPFVVDQLQGWQTLVRGSLEDVRQLLDKNSFASMRGLDKTLRDADAGGDEKQELLAWKILVLGYARQFDYCIIQIDKRVGYYNIDDAVVFYAREIKQRLLEMEAILLHCSTLKELDASLDSNKVLISAMQKNVDNLFMRLIACINPRNISMIPSVGGSSNKVRDYMNDLSGLGGRNPDDDTVHSLRGWA
jgi:hypothetical protein